jgi:transcription elongation GreA/GreB family factor
LLFRVNRTSDAAGTSDSAGWVQLVPRAKTALTSAGFWRPMTSAKANKAALKEELLRAVAADLASLQRAHRAAVEGATHEQAKPENDKDTRALEQSYLARGQAKRAEELREGLAAIGRMGVDAFTTDRPVGVGALVTAEEGKRNVRLFIALYGGGSRLANGSVQVVTPKSPLGEALIGKRVGDNCEVLTGGNRRELELVGIE